MRTFSPEELAEIRDGYRLAANPAKQVGILADLYACSKQDIQRALGLPVTPVRRHADRPAALVRPRWSDQEEHTLIEMYGQGASYQQIADEVGRSRVAVIKHTSHLRTLGLLQEERGGTP